MTRRELRFNFRGVGRSDGKVGEVADAIEDLLGDS
jgi:alpha/beta superfamily hydrolase